MKILLNNKFINKDNNMINHTIKITTQITIITKEEDIKITAVIKEIQKIILVNYKMMKKNKIIIDYDI